MTINHITLQPDTGDDLAPLPYPFHVEQSGKILRQDFWKGDPAAVVGFVGDADSHDIVLSWAQVWADPQSAVGTYLVTVDRKGGFATRLPVIGRVHVDESDPVAVTSN